MMEELPAIIHKLSLQLWCPDYAAKEDEEQARAAAEQSNQDDPVVDPLASPPQDAVDAHGNVLDASEISALSLEGAVETHSLFSQKNLLRLGVLTDSQRTLSLFTPSIRDAVFRAWAGHSERSDSSSTGSTPTLLTRSQSNLESVRTTYPFSDNGVDSTTSPSRPPMYSSQSATTGLSLGSGRRPRSHGHGRKKKTRIVNLRKPKSVDDSTSESGDSFAGTETTETSSYLGGSEPAIPTRIPEEPEEDLLTPPRSPNTKVRFHGRQDSIDLGETPRRSRILPERKVEAELPTSINMSTPEPSAQPTEVLTTAAKPVTMPQASRLQRPVFAHQPQWSYPTEKSPSSTQPNVPIHSTPSSFAESPAAGIIEQAWMIKMAGELARRAHERKSALASSWSSSAGDREETPPPAYEVQ